MELAIPTTDETGLVCSSDAFIYNKTGLTNLKQQCYNKNNLTNVVNVVARIDARGSGRLSDLLLTGEGFE